MGSVERLDILVVDEKPTSSDLPSSLHLRVCQVHPRVSRIWDPQEHRAPRSLSAHYRNSLLIVTTDGALSSRTPRQCEEPVSPLAKVGSKRQGQGNEILEEEEVIRG